MALLYYVKFINPNNVKVLPPPLEGTSYHAKLLEALVPPSFFALGGGSYVQTFDNEAALTAYSNFIAMTAEQNELMTEWKNFNNITISYEVFETSSTIKAPAPYGN